MPVQNILQRNFMQDRTKIKSTRGRPRAFDKEQALQAATRLFQEQGYSGTSLDELANVMGIKRSSLNNTFGSKSELYQQTLAFYEQRMGAQLEQSLFDGNRLQTSLRNYFAKLLEIYCQDEGQGCFFSTSLPCIVRSEQAFKDVFLENQNKLESMFLARLAQEGGGDKTDPVTAQLLVGLQHTLSLRARAGIPEAMLLELSQAALARILLPHACQPTEQPGA